MAILIYRFMELSYFEDTGLWYWWRRERSMCKGHRNKIVDCLSPNSFFLLNGGYLYHNAVTGACTSNEAQTCR